MGPLPWIGLVSKARKQIEKVKPYKSNCSWFGFGRGCEMDPECSLRWIKPAELRDCDHWFIYKPKRLAGSLSWLILACRKEQEWVSRQRWSHEIHTSRQRSTRNTQGDIRMEAKFFIRLIMCSEVCLLLHQAESASWWKSRFNEVNLGAKCKYQ